MMVMTLEVFPLTFRKHSIKFDTMVLYSNYKKMKYRVTNLLKVLNQFLTNWKRRIVLNGQSSSWTNLKAGVLQSSILGPLLSVIYINDLVDGLSPYANLFADDTSLFSVINDSIITTLELNSDLARIKL